MANKKRETYTDLLIREVVAYLAWVAGNSSRSRDECDAFYRAARLVGQNQKLFVSRALSQMDWRDALDTATGKEASSAR